MDPKYATGMTNAGVLAKGISDGSFFGQTLTGKGGSQSTQITAAGQSAIQDMISQKTPVQLGSNNVVFTSMGLGGTTGGDRASISFKGTDANGKAITGNIMFVPSEGFEFQISGGSTYMMNYTSTGILTMELKS